MATTFTEVNGDGSTVTFNFSFPYISTDHVQVLVDGVAATIDSFPTAQSVTVTVAPAGGTIVRVQRVTPVAPLVDFSNGARLRESELDLLVTQSNYVAEEGKDLGAEGKEDAALALGQAATAISDAATAQSTADVASSNATLALTNAGNAQSTADTAVSNAAAADSKADAAQSTADSALSKANANESTLQGAGFTTPPIVGGDANKILQVNATEDAYELVAPDAITGSGGGDTSNQIFNGDFQVWQRGPNSFADLWKPFTIGLGGGQVAITRETDVPTFAQSGHVSEYSMKLEVTTAEATIDNPIDQAVINFPLEGPDLAKLLGQDFITVSFWCKSNLTGTYGFAANSSTDSYVEDFTVDAANTWEKKVITIPFDEASVGAAIGAVFENSKGLDFKWVLAIAPMFQGGANAAWNETSQFTTSNITNTWFSTIGNDFFISQFQVVIGDAVPAGFKDHSFSETMAHCQRYYYKTFQLDTTPDNNQGNGGAVSWFATAGGNFSETVNLPVPMRANGSITWYNPNATGDGEAHSYDGANASTPVTIGNNDWRNRVVIVPNPPDAADADDRMEVHFTLDASL